MAMVGWDVKSLLALGNVEGENTRNLGFGQKYAEIKVPGPGLLFNSFQLNHSYEDTDVLISLAKLKNHTIAGITLSMKNMFGITPCSLYGDDAGSEDAIQARGSMHGGGRWGRAVETPGLKQKLGRDAGFVVPRVVVDLCAACPVHLAVIDGITSMSGGEDFGRRASNQWPRRDDRGAQSGLHGRRRPGGHGLSRSAGGTGTTPFENGDNHLLLAERAGLGTADLSQIDVRGCPREGAYSFHS